MNTKVVKFRYENVSMPVIRIPSSAIRRCLLFVVDRLKHKQNVLKTKFSTISNIFMRYVPLSTPVTVSPSPYAPIMVPTFQKVDTLKRSLTIVFLVVFFSTFCLFSSKTESDHKVETKYRGMGVRYTARRTSIKYERQGIKQWREVFN